MATQIAVALEKGEPAVVGRALAERIARNPGAALRLSKRLLREAQTVPLESLLELSAAGQALMHVSAEHEAAVTAYFAKRG